MRWSSSGFRLAALALAVFLAGCTNQQPMPELSGLPEQPEDFPLKRYRGLAAEGWQVHVPNPASRVHIRVGRAGSLRARAHSHIISTSDIRGLAARQGNELIADLYIPITSLVVDDPVLRSRQEGDGFERPISDEARRDTRANMLSELVLDVARFPFLKAGVSPQAFEPGRNEVVVGINVRGERRPVRVPMQVELGEPLRLSGQFTIRHDEFGLEPFSALGGAVRVAEEIEVEFELLFDPPPAR